MKNRFSKILTLCMVIVLALMTCTLTACNKNKEKERQRIERERRVTAVNSVKGSFLSGLNAEWRVDLDNETLSKRADAGDYIVTKEWIDLLCGVLDASALQTSKLSAFADALRSEDAKQLFEDFETNAQLLIPLMRQVGFTSADMSALVYDLLIAAVNESGAAMDKMIARFESMIVMPNITVASKRNVQANQTRIISARTNFAPGTDEKQQMIDAIDQARPAMSELVGFAYNMLDSVFSESIFDKIFSDGEDSAEGVFENISDEEILTVLDSLKLNVRALQNALDTDARTKLNAALDIVINKFDKTLNSFAIFSQIVRYAKYAYTLVDTIPLMCEAVLSLGNSLDAEFLAVIREFVRNYDSYEDRAVQEFNKGIIAAKLFTGVMNDEAFTAQSVKSMLSDMLASVKSGGGYDYQKALPLVIADMVCVYTYDGTVKGDDRLPDIGDMTPDDVPESADVVFRHDAITEEILSDMIEVAVFGIRFETFKDTYIKFSNGTATENDLLNAAVACSFGKYGLNNQYSLYSREWYDYYTAKGTELLNTFTSRCIDAAVNDLSMFADDYYSKDHTLADKLAALPLLKQGDTYDQATIEEIYGSYIGTLLMMIGSFV